MATYISFIGKGQLVDKSKHQAGSSTDVSLPENRTAFEYGYKEVEYQAVEYPPTKEILGEIEDLQKELAGELAKLREML